MAHHNEHYVLGKEEKVIISFDGIPLFAHEDDTIASALYRAGIRSWRRTPSGKTRGLFCGVGHCFDCVITVDGVEGVRACLTRVQQGMIVKTCGMCKENK